MGDKKKHLDFITGRRAYDSTVDTVEDVKKALQQLFSAVASDLGVDDLKDAAFDDYARDTMSGYQVPRDVMDAALGRQR